MGYWGGEKVGQWSGGWWVSGVVEPWYGGVVKQCRGEAVKRQRQWPLVEWLPHRMSGLDVRTMQRRRGCCGEEIAVQGAEYSSDTCDVG